MLVDTAESAGCGLLSRTDEVASHQMGASGRPSVAVPPPSALRQVERCTQPLACWRAPEKGRPVNSGRKGVPQAAGSCAPHTLVPWRHPAAAFSRICDKTQGNTAVHCTSKELAPPRA